MTIQLKAFSRKSKPLWGKHPVSQYDSRKYESCTCEVCYTFVQCGALLYGIHRTTYACTQQTLACATAVLLYYTTVLSSVQFVGKVVGGRQEVVGGRLRVQASRLN